MALGSPHVHARNVSYLGPLMPLAWLIVETNDGELPVVREGVCSNIRQETSFPPVFGLTHWLWSWLFRSLSSACVHEAISSPSCESALSSRTSQSTKRQ